MKKIISLAVVAAAMVALNGCKPGDLVGTSSVYIDDLDNGYKISGTDSKINKSADLCFLGDNYVYGRGSEYFEGTFYIDGGDIVFRDATDGGSYRLNTGGELTKGYRYYFTGITNNIGVESISSSSSLNDCRAYGNKLRVASSLGLGRKQKN